MSWPGRVERAMGGVGEVCGVISWRRTLFSAIEHQQAVAAKTTGILKLRDLIDWESFRPLLEELTG